jgi:hypothetical protein
MRFGFARANQMMVPRRQRDDLHELTQLSDERVTVGQ